MVFPVSFAWTSLLLSLLRGEVHDPVQRKAGGMSLSFTKAFVRNA
jgi:hypothetical protein